MFADPLATYAYPDDTLTSVSLPRISTNPSRYRFVDPSGEREMVISHSNSPVKGTQNTRKSVSVTYTRRKTVAPVTIGQCCTPGYTQIVNSKFSFDYIAGTPINDIQDVVKSLGVWISEATDIQVIDKLVNGES